MKVTRFDDLGCWKEARVLVQKVRRRDREQQVRQGHEVGKAGSVRSHFLYG